MNYYLGFTILSLFMKLFIFSRKNQPVPDREKYIIIQILFLQLMNPHMHKQERHWKNICIIMKGYVFFNVFPLVIFFFINWHIKFRQIIKYFPSKLSCMKIYIKYIMLVKYVVVSVSNCHKNEKNLGTGDNSTKTHIPPFRNKSFVLGEFV